METVVWIGLSQSLFSGTVLLTVKKDKTLPDILLSFWLIISAFEFLTSGIDISRGFIHLSNPFLIFNPLLYFYTRSLIYPRKKLKWWYLVHVLPYFLIKVCGYFFNIELSTVDFFKIDHSTWFKMTLGVASVLSFAGYSIPSIIMVHRHRINLKNEFSSINRQITLGWLLFVIIFYMIYMVAAYTLGIIDIFTEINTYAQFVTFASLLVLIYIFSFYGLLQKQIYRELPGKLNKTVKYRNSRLSEKEKKEIEVSLEKYFVLRKPFLNSELTINHVATSLGIPRHSLTEVLNTVLGKNFFRFVNEYRVEEVKKKLADNAYDHYSFDAIGYECGFNSKSSFYSVFKNITGKTPQEYKSSLK